MRHGRPCGIHLVWPQIGLVTETEREYRFTDITSNLLRKGRMTKLYLNERVCRSIETVREVQFHCSRRALRPWMAFILYTSYPRTEDSGQV